MKLLIITLLTALCAFGFTYQAMATGQMQESETNMAEQSDNSYATAVFAGGCFWCMEKPYDKIDGIIKTLSGYAGGEVDNPTYEQVSAGGTGHREVIQVTYDPAKVSYDKLIEIFWRNVDPFDGAGQFCDKGFQYTSAIYYGSDEEKKIAETTKSTLEKRFGKTIETAIVPDATFYPAEGYHQNYYTENPVRYRFYRWNCGRDQRLDKVWGEEARADYLHQEK